MLRKLVMVSLVLVMLCISHFASAADQEEAVQSFVSHITVNTDASINVTEYITVYTHGQETHIIRDALEDNKNIFSRYIPVEYVDSNGNWRSLQYKLKNVLMNDKAYTYNIYMTMIHGSINFYNKVSIGKNNLILDQGTYTYTISYRILNAVTFQENKDEFYWNITGVGWKLPILNASVVITLPEGAVISEGKAYIATDKENDQEIQVNKTADNQIEVLTSVLLKPKNSIMVKIAWQKGIVTQPGWRQIHQLDFQVFIMVSLIILYYLLVWFVFGKDLRMKPTAPIYEPPANLTPEAMYYVSNIGVDDGKTFVCSIVNMAVNGC